MYGNKCQSRATMLSWHKMFLSGRESTELQHIACSRHPTTAPSEVNVNTVRVLIVEDRSITYHKMAAIMNCPKTIENIMKRKLRMWEWHHLRLAQICEDTDQVEATLG